ncbi:hypothetical protein EXU48_08465 [Occultella glacieicola]|uniref:Pyrrolo-quinoline quinone repeat domain-containing protein n=1 Tax=Occultella glacieicola TaxID=2518684 RepID=A0ABY2E465_9MICO|nr:PQQ-binding-like beta-propeller repeat protein [Occultella glacieicola]TDE94820.1 hypothetical protein EXU48_08465 [Occultella glacieicola]
MGRGRVDEFVLDFDEPALAADPGRPAGTTSRSAGASAGWRSPVLWGSFAVLLVVLGIVVAPPPPVPSWRVGPAWSQPPEQRWSVPLSATMSSPRLVVEDAHVFVADDGRIDAYGRTDGELRWSIAEVHDCVRAELFVCLSGSGADAVVSVVDDDGTVRTVPAPGALAATLYRGDLILLTEGAAAGDDLTLHVGLDLDQLRWSTAVEAADEFRSLGRPGVIMRDDLVLVSNGALYRARTGEHIPGSWSYQLEDAPLISWGGGRSQYIPPGTDRVLDLPGLGWPALVDDGSVPPVTLAQGTGDVMEAMDADGQVLWQVPYGIPLARLGGVLVILGSSTVSGREPRTGELLWTTPENMLCPCRGDASGLLLYAFEVDPDGALTNTRLVGMSIADGKILWEMPMPDGAVIGDAEDAVAVLLDDQLSLYARN